MLRFELNLHKPDNYAFFCPVSKMHLTLSNPIGYADRVTPAIENAMDANCIFQTNEPGAVTTEESVKEQEENTEENAEENTEENAEAAVNEIFSETVEEEKPKKKTAKK